MTTTTHGASLLREIENIANVFLEDMTYSDQKEQQLRDLGFTQSTYIEEAQDYRQFHDLAIDYNQKYPDSIYLTERQYKIMLKHYELFGYSISECKTDIPDEILGDLLNIEVEMGIVAKGKDKVFNAWYDEVKKMSYSLYRDIIIGGHGYGKEASVRHGVVENVIYAPTYPVLMKNVLNPNPLVRWADGSIANALGIPQLTTGTDTMDDKKKKHLEKLPITLAEIKKEYPSALVYLRDNIADKPGEQTNHLIALKVEGGYFILTHWEG
ncbi:hypothetical protein ACRQ5D_10790 [Mucilaginibacter sp. P25]|uniref:hypothetical protein n=1 Tax=Mucilaginibacter sp. P25 TaxID=3423945 RepID=UPI003D7BE535